jgi:hypothetical protein
MSAERADVGLHFERAATGTALPLRVSLSCHGSFLQLLATIATELLPVRVLRAAIPAFHGHIRPGNRSMWLKGFPSAPMVSSQGEPTLKRDDWLILNRRVFSPGFKPLHRLSSWNPRFMLCDMQTRLTGSFLSWQIGAETDSFSRSSSGRGVDIELHLSRLRACLVDHLHMLRYGSDMIWRH